MDATVTTSRIVRLDAKPEPIALEIAKTAVIVVDMENDFVAKGGRFDRAGVDISGAQKAISPTAKVLATERRDVQRLFVCVAERLHERTDWTRFAKK